MGAAVLLMGWVAAAQDPAGIKLLERIKGHMRDEVSRLPNYTCLQTISRFKNEPGSSRLKRSDMVRLEILYSKGREWYGAPGDQTFSTDDPLRLTGGGMIGTGAFAIMLHNVFVSDSVDIEYGGRVDEGGRVAAKYDFRLPRPSLEITVPGGSGTAGQEGSFWVDPESLDLIRLEAR